MFTIDRVTKFLKEAREGAELTQIEMAEKLNMTQSHVSKYERGRRDIDLATFMRWVQVTNSEMQAATILFGTEIFNMATQVAPLIPAFVNLHQLFM